MQAVRQSSLDAKNGDVSNVTLLRMALMCSASSGVALRRMIVLTCFNGRPKVSELFLRHTSPILPIYAACSEGDHENIALCEHYGVTFCVVPNEPLGAKWNAALGLVPDGEAVMILGSDDFVSREWVELASLAIGRGHHYISPSRIAMFDAGTRRAMMLERNPNGAQTFGAGRVLSAEVVSKVRPMWDDGIDRAMDTNAHAKVIGQGFSRHTIDPMRVPVMALKSGENIWTYDRWMWAGRHCSELDALSMLSDDLVSDLINSWRTM